MRRSARRRAPAEATLPTVVRLLLAAAPADERAFVAGDLLEAAAAMRPRDGDDGDGSGQGCGGSEAAARRWLLRQAVRSLAPFLLMRWGRGHLLRPLLLAELLFVLPAVLLDRLWSLTLSQVPLRADTLADGQLALSVGLLAALAALAGWADAGARADSVPAERTGAAARTSPAGEPLALPLLVAAAAALLAATFSRLPPGTGLALVLVAPAAAWLGGRLFHLVTAPRCLGPLSRRNSS